ncbi:MULTISPECIES: hydrogenase expression/formation C-terminal domain-containing protein [unclassified Wenzhouxiangella]|uniref:hydrogenase expression/formation C-terminal domain-containing protein n=1 Tax=unclassified Wenzhouxiangella TaxID=2613841 RepID=UPI000E32560D|nr:MULTISPECIES: hydrogenase expression/formation C-terminal domain-containing protein [unclassified Wenzhouxiangella]RFF28068.1 hydrogenase expression/formation protein [Wenzhouxiangella sp. 15181]RFP68654.1 hydrogenase expression/formation protein [Wenzhouxiangella sp. 15190]
MNTGQLLPLRVKTEPPPAPGDDILGGGVRALGYEIAARLETLHETGESGAIDIKSIPMAAAEFESFRQMLGQGEVDFTLELDGQTRIRETAFPGVWWIQHKDPEGQVVAEHIEINHVPDLLRAQAEEIGQAADALRARLNGET